MWARILKRMECAGDAKDCNLVPAHVECAALSLGYVGDTRYGNELVLL